MPGRDQTGPSGTGPTGRRVGPCANSENDIGGRWQRQGRGFWPRRHQNWPVPVSPAEEKEFLEAEQNWLQKRIDAISKRLEELK
jgi:hypothetical protein